MDRSASENGHRRETADLVSIAHPNDVEIGATKSVRGAKTNAYENLQRVVHN